MPTPTLHILGVRHHGPGSARSLLAALGQLDPDCILVEGPPDAHDVLPLLAHKEMKPPVALLIYSADDPRDAVYYPFAVFSPEYQALRHALKHKIPVRFMDLPQAHQLGQPLELKLKLKPAPNTPPTPDDPAPCAPTPEEAVGGLPPGAAPDAPPTDSEDPRESLRRDPLRALAEAAGYSDSERWWEHMVEQRRDATDLFAAVLEAMTALRHELPDATEPEDLTREAFMRQTIRAAQKEGFERIAVVCGAWHGPALATMPSEKEDAARLKNLPKTKVISTWVPWTYGRLCNASGYGAGVRSPGWYHHLWQHGNPEAAGGPNGRNGNGKADKSTKGANDKARGRRTNGAEGTAPASALSAGASPALIDSTALTVSWMTKIARLLRGEDLDASSASVIESVRLAESLAALRGRPLPGLPEMTESAQAVLCFGNDVPIQLVHQKLIIGETLGEVPDETPMVPLQQDLTRLQKKLRLPPEALQKTLELDLRKETDLERSLLLHRLSLLGIPWGELEGSSGKGTFKEIWRLQWQPEFAVTLIEHSRWGNTVLDAATAFSRDAADKAPDLPTLTALLGRVLFADLPGAIHHLMTRLANEAAIATDINHLMDALPPLANTQRYGSVRNTDTSTLSHIIDGLVARVCIGLPAATSSLNDDAAREMFERLQSTHAALSLLQNPSHLAAWNTVLRQLSNSPNLHGLLAGRATRILLDAQELAPEDAATRMSLALSTANDPAHAAAWIEGFLKGSGLLLLHDDALWNVLDSWVTSLPEDTFTPTLPLLRRTFSTFDPPERRQMHDRVKRGGARPAPSRLTPDRTDFDTSRADAVLPLIKQLLGLS